MELRKTSLALLSAGVLGAGGIVIATPAQAAARHEAMAKLPAEKTQGEVHFVSGGVGHDEAQAFERAEHGYPLGLEFAVKAKPHNEFTADVRVVIRNEKGATVLDTVSSGPFLLAKLPAGKYDVRATQHGKTLRRSVTVAADKPTHVGFLWQAG